MRLKVIVPVGGFGTRLRPITYTRPKSLLPIYNTTVLGFIINHLSKFKFIDEVIVAANKQFQEIKSSLEDINGELKISYIWEEKRMGGVACIKNASKGIYDDYMVFLGDNLSDVNLTDFLRFHKMKKADASIMLVPSETPWLYGVPVTDEHDYILSLIEKPKDPKFLKNRYIATGVYIFKKDALDVIEENKFIDHTGEIFPIILDSGGKVAGFKTGCFWTDIGSFNNYREANRWVIEKYHKNQSTASKEAEYSIDEISYVESSSQIGRGSSVDSSSMILKNCRIGFESRITNSIVFENTVVGKSCSIINSFICENVLVEDKVNIEDSVIGAAAEIKSNSVIKNSKIWPKISIESDSKIEGDIKHLYLPLK